MSKGEIIASDKEITALYENKYVALSNALIQAREKTSLLESKIELLAIYKMSDEMKSVEKTDTEGNIYNVHAVTINANEIRQLVGKGGGSLYGRIESAALELKQKLYIYRNPGENQFRMSSLYGDVVYEDGKLTIEYNPSMEYLFLDLKENYTKLKLDIALKYVTNGGFQLYKLLKSYVYTLPEIDPTLPQESQKSLTKKYSLSELRLQLGYVDLNQPDIKLEGAKKHPDIEKMTEMEKKPKYKRWTDFNNRVLIPGMEEVNRISDIYIASITKKCGSHGKVDEVEIVVQNNLDYYLRVNNIDTSKTQKNENIVDILSEEEKITFYDEVIDIIKEPIKIKDAKAIAEAAEYNLDIIKQKYAFCNDADNVVGWLITAIKENWSNPLSKRKQTFTQRDYDFDKLEKEILSN